MSIFALTGEDLPPMIVVGDIEPATFRQEAKGSGHPDLELVPVTSAVVALSEVALEPVTIQSE